MSKPLKLLLSATALERWGARIAAAVPAGTLAFLTVEAAVADSGPCDADIAFMTRDVTGRSGKGSPSPERIAFDALMRRSPRLQWLQIHPAGADRPIYTELHDRGVKVTTASGATAVTVAHSILGGIIAVNRRFPLLADAQRRHAWEPRIGPVSPRDLGGQHAVIVGLGPIGQNLAPLLRMLGMTVTGVRRKATPVEGCNRTITFEDIDGVLPAADWLILCCPLSPVTRGLGHSARFAAMPKGSHIVNAARGSVVVEADLIEALRSGHLGGAYLDVFEMEPLEPSSPLWDLPNVIVSPHTASNSLGQADAVCGVFLDNLARFRAGQSLRNDIGNLG